MEIFKTLDNYGYFLPRRLQKSLIFEGESCEMSVQINSNLSGTVKVSGDWDTMIDFVPNEELLVSIRSQKDGEERYRERIRFLTVEAPREYALREMGQFYVTLNFESHNQERFFLSGRRPKNRENETSFETSEQISNHHELA